MVWGYLCQKCLNILITHIAYKKNCHILMWWYQHILISEYHDSLIWKITNEKSAILSKKFWFIPTSHETFSITNCLKTQTTYYLTNPIFSHRLLQLISDLACTTCVKQILQLNLNCTKLIKCIDDTNFLTLDYFSPIENGFYFFFYLLTCTNPTFLLDIILQALIFCKSLFHMPYVVHIYYAKPYV